MSEEQNNEPAIELKPGQRLTIKTPVGNLILEAEKAGDADEYGCHTIVSWQRDNRIFVIDNARGYTVLGRKPESGKSL